MVSPGTEFDSATLLSTPAILLGPTLALPSEEGRERMQADGGKQAGLYQEPVQSEKLRVGTWVQA